MDTIGLALHKREIQLSNPVEDDTVTERRGARSAPSGAPCDRAFQPLYGFLPQIDLCRTGFSSSPRRLLPTPR